MSRAAFTACYADLSDLLAIHLGGVVAGHWDYQIPRYLMLAGTLIFLVIFFFDFGASSSSSSSPLLLGSPSLLDLGS